jgi:hypothetical protein
LEGRRARRRGKEERRETGKRERRGLVAVMFYKEKR